MRRAAERDPVEVFGSVGANRLLNLESGSRELVEGLRHGDDVLVEEVGAVDQDARDVAVGQAQDLSAVAHGVERLLGEVVEGVAVGGDQIVERLDVAGARRLDEHHVVDARRGRTADPRRRSCAP